ncbi:hypothetical protein [Clostridium sp. DJ247]|uniref:hypothetical protein n=1 Tax=Clostridium sp. DJ247 TaxID=2726188 RepID=UPI00162360E5|nr:hypothetical protein [Clostridium sp. DJ247]MBC2580436.1 hypothetical protein [Clostridium sp. DJ247]
MNREKLMSKVIPAIVAGSVLLSTGTLVFAQSSTKEAKSQTVHTQHLKENFKNSTENIKAELDKLVSASTITQDQENKILDFIKQKGEAAKVEREKIKNLSEAERQAYFANKSKEKPNLANELVSAGIVSQDQANAVVKALHPGNKGAKGSNETIKAKFDKLVSSSVISQDQENKILDYIKQKNDARKAEMDKVKNMSETERQAYFASNPKQKTDLLSELVNAGIISQDQANSIKQTMPEVTKSGNGYKKGVNKDKTKTDTNTNSASTNS